MNRRLLSFILGFLTALGSVAQPVVQIDSLPAQGVLLNKGWKWHAGDNPDWAKPDFEDSQWEIIDPTKDIFELPQMPKTGQIGWLRIKLSIANPNQSALSISIQQVGASEIYLNGRIIHRIGYLSLDRQRIKALNPNQFPYSLPATTDSVQTLAIRYAFQPNIRYSTHFGMTNPLFRLTLRPTDEVASDYTNRYNRALNRDFAKTAVFATLSLLFFILFVFFPVRKAHLYFGIYALLFALSWSLSSFVKPPAFVETFYWINNALLIVQTIGYLFMLNAVYATFQSKKGLWYCAVMLSGIIAILTGALAFGWGWLLFGFFFANFISIDVTRVSAMAVRQQRKGAWILLTGCIGYLVCWFIFSLQFSGVIRAPRLLEELLFDISVVLIPVAFAVFLAYDFGLISRVLQQKLEEVETLSAEKQHILATENERLDQQVTERTAELAGKNRELMIEAALDKVRSRALAMHKSDELKEVVAVLFQQLKGVGLAFDGGAGIVLFRPESTDAVILVVTEFQPPVQVSLPYDEEAFENNPIITDVWQAHRTGTSICNRFYSFEEKNKYFDYVFKHNSLDAIAQPIRDFIRQADSYTASFIAEKNSLLGTNSWSHQALSGSELAVLTRMAKTFEQAYVRFLDLQKAEALTREAQIQLALERVRARTMAMQESGELTEVAELLFKQVSSFGIQTWTTGFNVWSDDNNFYTDYITNPQGGFMPPFTIDARILPTSIALSKAKKRGDKFFVNYQDGEQLAEVYRQLSKFGPTQFKELVNSGFAFPTSQYEYFVFGQKVSLMFITYEPVAEAHELFRRFANVFEQTYTRFLDLQKAEAQARQAQLDLIQIQIEKKRAEEALAELRITQAQLVQKEKLASLGELTAGIAHEIQNPLNFVNNFSEVSTELMTELIDELAKGEPAEAKFIAEDVQQNLRKIHHHGGRASAIVKGMLEHARPSTGVNELTNLNTLTDEYVKLAYHGIRAKDKDFICEIVTHFDSGVSQINLIPQEIGRVLLNLFSNAFYAVRERQKQGETGYIPTVTVTTAKTPAGVQLRVADNGTGMADRVQQKIFQPFFTTKPTGEGTGLGLSLSYDIVTKGHGGSLTVESQVGAGSVFTIQLPTQAQLLDHA